VETGSTIKKKKKSSPTNIQLNQSKKLFVPTISLGFLILFKSHHWRTCTLPVKNLHVPLDMRLYRNTIDTTEVLEQKLSNPYMQHMIATYQKGIKIQEYRKQKLIKNFNVYAKGSYRSYGYPKKRPIEYTTKIKHQNQQI
jgi:hypothetical protein